MKSETALSQPGNQAALLSLRWRWLVFLMVSVGAIFSIVWLFYQNISLPFARQWGVQAAIVLLYQAVLIWRALPKNHRHDEDHLLPSFGLGNLVSLLRTSLIALIAGFFFLPRPEGWLAWLPALIYVVVAVTDYVDGYLARISNHVTKLGEILDMNNDSLSVLSVTLLLYQYGIVPWWYAIFGFARYFFLFGLWWRKQRGLPVYELKPSMPRRGFAGIQMGFLATVLFPVFGPPSTHWAAGVFLLPFAVRFVYDYLQVSGRIEAIDLRQDLFWQRIWRFTAGWLALGLRLLAAALLFVSAVAAFQRGGTFLVFSGFEVFFGIMLLLGFAGRVAAFFALILLGFRMLLDPFSALYAAMLTALIAILFLGSGLFSLWRPEDWLVHNRAGERRVS